MRVGCSHLGRSVVEQRMWRMIVSSENSAEPEEQQVTGRQLVGGNTIVDEEKAPSQAYVQTRELTKNH